MKGQCHIYCPTLLSRCPQEFNLPFFMIAVSCNCLWLLDFQSAYFYPAEADGKSWPQSWFLYCLY